jgi:hypothetical protein
MSPKKFTKEKITKEDGRYVIFYTFGDEESRVESGEVRDLRPQTRDQRLEPGAQSQETEVRS